MSYPGVGAHRRLSARGPPRPKFGPEKMSVCLVFFKKKNKDLRLAVNVLKLRKIVVIVSKQSPNDG